MDTLTPPLTTLLLIRLSPPPLSAICLRLLLVAAFLVAPHQRTGTPPAVANALIRAAHLPALRTQCNYT